MLLAISIKRFFKDDDYFFNGFHLKIFCSILDEQNFCLHFILHTVTLKSVRGFVFVTGTRLDEFLGASFLKLHTLESLR